MKGKVIHIQTIKAHGADARVHIYTATALERGRLASPTRGRFYPVETVNLYLLILF